MSIILLMLFVVSIVFAACAILPIVLLAVAPVVLIGISAFGPWTVVLALALIAITSIIVCSRLLRAIDTEGRDGLLSTALIND